MNSMTNQNSSKDNLQKLGESGLFIDYWKSEKFINSLKFIVSSRYHIHYKYSRNNYNKPFWHDNEYY